MSETLVGRSVARMRPTCGWPMRCSVGPRLILKADTSRLPIDDRRGRPEIASQHDQHRPSGPRPSSHSDARINPPWRLACVPRASAAWSERRPLLTFFVLSCLFSWWPAVVAAFSSSEGGLAGFGRFVAAVVVLALTRGRSGVKDLLASMIKWRVPPRAYLAAIGIPIGITAVAILLTIATGAAMPSAAALGAWTADPAHGGADAAESGDGWSLGRTGIPGLRPRTPGAALRPVGRSPTPRWRSGWSGTCRSF